MSIYNRKHWHALSHSLHFVRHPPSQASKSGSGLPSIFNSVCLGLVQGQTDSPYLTMMSWITIPRDEYYTSQRKRTTYRDASTGFPSKSSLRNERRNSILMTFTKRIWAVLLSDWLCRVGIWPQPIRSTIQTWVLTSRQYGIAVLIPQTS